MIQYVFQQQLQRSQYAGCSPLLSAGGFPSASRVMRQRAHISVTPCKAMKAFCKLHQSKKLYCRSISTDLYVGIVI
jgi:hypothetical protein